MFSIKQFSECFQRFDNKIKKEKKKKTIIIKNKITVRVYGFLTVVYYDVIYCKPRSYLKYLIFLRVFCFCICEIVRIQLSATFRKSYKYIIYLDLFPLTQFRQSFLFYSRFRYGYGRVKNTFDLAI